MNYLLALYANAKFDIAAYFGASEALLHLHFGLAIFFLAALVSRRRMNSPVPILAVYFFAFVNEVIDWWQPGRPRIEMEPAFDILNTVIWPTLLFFLAMRRGGKLRF